MGFTTNKQVGKMAISTHLATISWGYDGDIVEISSINMPGIIYIMGELHWLINMLNSWAWSEETLFLDSLKMFQLSVDFNEKSTTCGF